MECNNDAKQLSDIRNLFEGMKGHNFGLPDCIKFILERVGGHEELDFWNIAAITGDTVAQIYNHNLTTRCEYCVSGYLAGPEHIAYVFDVLGYSHEYVKAGRIIVDKTNYLRKIVEYINKGVPILVKSNLNDIPEWESDVGTYILIVGYENGGQTLKLLIHDTITIDYEINDENKLDLIFIGEKQREVSLQEIYLKVIKKMPHWLTLPERNGMFFGASAYRVWADDIEAGRFEDESLGLWENYGVYVCNLATSGGEPTYIFRQLADMNPAYSELVLLGEKIQKLLPAETPSGGRSLLWIQLEELGGGMNMGDVKTTMRDKEKRSKVAAALRDYAERLDQALELLKEGLRRL
ncbi:hypothetical protein [Paenibacillus spongiae]|uniref:Butirosin biosynthesis protein H N-terminal domain-containing protein n=1 Tax=Paenibacillus spongiae TaxID=2909671 RepID=A0ABY5S0J0_9BACL|nr:hypothetical protein [Paenibacillus spongiae]UVI27346.1 hypothetical protein L1F29_17875 [Paenibacillus spongiae]